MTEFGGEEGEPDGKACPRRIGRHATSQGSLIREFFAEKRPKFPLRGPVTPFSSLRIFPLAARMRRKEPPLDEQARDLSKGVRK